MTADTGVDAADPATSSDPAPAASGLVGPGPAPVPHFAECASVSVPEQARRQDPRLGSDPLEQPDAYAAADAAGTENLLRCWVREAGVAAPRGGTLRLPLPASGATLLVPVRHWSPAGHHRFGPPVLDRVPELPVDAVTLAALLGREAAAGKAGRRTDIADLVARVADSVRRTAVFLAHRRATPEPRAGEREGGDEGEEQPADRFLDAEQALILGHPLHPTPKSREGLSEAEAIACSPELRGAFTAHWLAVDRSVLVTDSAWTEHGRTVPAELLLTRLAGPRLRLPDGTAPLPLHPWQAREIRHRPQVLGLFEAGLLHDLGPAGEPWHPTSSVRTAYRSGGPAMLKLSLALRITNSRRENLRKELHRGVEVHRLLRGGLAQEWHSAFPRSAAGFDIVRDPAWLAVDTLGGEPVPGLNVVIRHNPFGPRDDVSCLAGLVSPRPRPGGGMRSRLADIVARLASRTGRPGPAVAAEWFLRYLDAVIRPVLWLDGEAGIALEAHQQNTLVVLDTEGWPVGGRYRDNQGYYFRESHRAALDRRLPGVGTESDSFVDDDVIDHHVGYYIGVNNVLGLVGAFGSQRLADEGVLLAAFRHFLGRAAATGRSGLPALLLEASGLPCKANLLTRLHGMDELVGPVDTQSVYVTIPNPLTAATP
jgi:siderophore synthetase component